MAVALDGTAVAAGAITGGTSLTLAKTSTGSDRCAVVHIGSTSATPEGITVAYGASGRATLQALSRGVFDYTASIHTLIDPPTASTNVVITLLSAGSARIVVSSFNGVSRVPVRQRNKNTGRQHQ